MVRFLYVTDAHGDINVYEKMFELGKEREINFLVFGGDITSGFDPKGQKFFLEFYLIRRLEEFKKETNKPVFIMMGNDDFSSNFRILKRAGKKKILKLLHNRFYSVCSHIIAGYPFINPTPFLLKDWEKGEETMAKDLEKLFEGFRSKKTICVFHAPPLGTKLDMLFNGEHRGSEAIRRFIEKKQPLLTLHGHIHESCEVSGAMKQKIGRTLCINPGNGKIISIGLDGMKIEEMK
jgi:Icc-related predicted phosphoesterase